MFALLHAPLLALREAGSVERERAKVAWDST
jgi:hypothetical protein